MLEGGDVFAIRRWRRKSDGLTLPLQIQLMEADHLDANRFTHDPRGRTSQGIEYDAIGRRVAYHLFPDHPGDTTRATWGRLDFAPGEGAGRRPPVRAAADAEPRCALGHPVAARSARL